MTYLILAEKPSAAKNFADAYGGMRGSYNGQKYIIVSLYGHMVSFAEPHEMVSDIEEDNFKSWEAGFMPWDTTKMNWKRVPQTGRDRNGKKTTKATQINAIKKISKEEGITSIIIATDKDPSAEGQLIGWGLIHAIGWKGDVKRIYFLDESKKSLQKGFKDMEDLPSADKDGEYLKSNLRSRWDFVSMQLTRLSTSAARSKGYNVVVRQGRLKSVMTKLVADQLALVKAYKKKPYFEVKYKDDNGNNYGRKFDDEVDTFRFNSKAEAEKDSKNYNVSDVVVDSKSNKETAPGKLLDLGGLSAILGTKGFKAKEVLATYQKMYEAKIVSYPRTEDKIISKEQFKEMLPLVDRIADVVGADKSLLTHRNPRSTHVKDGGAHGANRPGLVVPSNLKGLSKYGASATAIYELLAKNFLAMFGENYKYESIKAHIKDHPEFTTIVNIPTDLGFKAIFDSESESSDEDKENEDNSKGVGKIGNPVIAEGVNKKPPYPTHKWLERQLSRYDVGTGATRVGTLSEVTNGKAALLTDTRGRLDLTKVGEIASVLLEGSQIGDPSVTESLFKSMNDVGKLTVPADKVLATATSVVKHDKEVFYRNAEKLLKLVGEPDIKVKPKATGVYFPTGKKITFNKEWSGCEFSEKQISELLGGKVITIEAISKTKKPFKVEGKLEEQEYKGKKFWGFRPDFKSADDYDITNAPFPSEWSGYKFKSTDEVKLRNGESINIKAISKAKKPYEVEVSFGIDEYKGNKSWKIIPNFKDSSDYNISNAPFPKSWSGYTFKKTDEETLRLGGKIVIKAINKAKKPYDVEVSFGVDEYKGNKSWKIIPNFKTKKPASEFTRENAPFKAEFGGLTLDETQIAELRAGHKIMVSPISAKTGNPYTCNLSLEITDYKGNKAWRLKPDFK